MIEVTRNKFVALIAALKQADEVLEKGSSCLDYLCYVIKEAVGEEGFATVEHTACEKLMQRYFKFQGTRYDGACEDITFFDDVEGAEPMLAESIQIKDYDAESGEFIFAIYDMRNCASILRYPARVTVEEIMKQFAYRRVPDSTLTAVYADAFFKYIGKDSIEVDLGVDVSIS